MNCVEKLVKKYKGKSVWFDLHDEEAKQHFKRELLKLNVRWSDGSEFEKEHNISGFMAINEGRVIAFVAGFIWAYSFRKEAAESFDGKEIVRVNYKKYIDGEKDYLIITPNITYGRFTFPLKVRE